MTVLAPGCGPNAPTVAGTDARAAAATQTSGAGTLHTFTLHNTSSTAATAAMARLGLAFTKGDVPAGKRLTVRVKGGQPVVFAAWAARNSWADGSLRSTADAGLVMVDSSPIAAGKSRTYEVYAVAGSPAKSGFDPAAWLAAHGNDLTVAVTARTGSATGPKPDLLFSLKTAIATTTRREILCDTRRFVRIKVWQKVPQEEHLICEYHLDFWLDASAKPVGLEFAPVLSQHWWVANPFGTTQTKERYTYDAVVSYGTTVLDSRSRLDHAYYCRWASLRPQDDAQHARKHWIGLGLSQMPMVRVRYDDSSLKRMMRAGYIPPLRLGVPYSSRDSYPTTHDPLGANPTIAGYPNGHRANLPGTGDYPGRGIWGNPDAKLASLQGSGNATTAELAWRKSRVMAQAGLSVYTHFRDHRSISGVNGGTDAPNRVMPLPFRQTAAVGSQSYVGLGTPVVYNRGALSDDAAGYSTIGHNAPTGGTGAFISYEYEHVVNYSAPMAFLEGEAYLGDASISQLIGQLSNPNWDGYANNPELYYSDNVVRGPARGVPTGPSTRYGAATSVRLTERSMAWGINVLNHAYAIRADVHPEQPFLKNAMMNTSAYLAANLTYYPTAHLTRGPYFVAFEQKGATAPWRVHWQALACYHGDRLAGDVCAVDGNGKTGFKRAAELSAKHAAGMLSVSPYSAAAYGMIWGSDGNSFLSPLPQDEWPFMMSVTFSGNVGTISRDPDYMLPTSLMPANGDKARIIEWHDDNGAQSVPAGITSGALYYLVNVSGNTFQLATTPGGNPVSIANSSIAVGFTWASFNPTTLTTPYPPDDSYIPIAVAAFQHAVGESHSAIDESLRDKVSSWFAPKAAAFSTYASWNYDSSNLQ